MQIFVAALLGGLAQVAGSLVGRVLLALGIGFVTYQGFDVALSLIADGIRNNLGALPSRITQVLGLMKVDSAANVIISSVVARQVINGVVSGSKRVLAQKI